VAGPLARQARGDVWVDDPSGEVAWFLFQKGRERRLWLLNTDWSVAGNEKDVTVHLRGRTHSVRVRHGAPRRLDMADG